MKQAFEKLDIIGREEAFEQDFTNWVNARKSRQEKYGNALAQIEKGVQETAPAMDAATLLSESLGRIEVLGFANSLIRSITTVKKDDMSYEEAIATAVDVMSDALYKDYNEALDRKEAEALSHSTATTSRTKTASRCWGRTSVRWTSPPLWITCSTARPSLPRNA